MPDVRSDESLRLLVVDVALLIRVVMCDVVLGDYQGKCLGTG